MKNTNIASISTFPLPTSCSKTRKYSPELLAAGYETWSSVILVVIFVVQLVVQFLVLLHQFGLGLEKFSSPKLSQLRTGKTPNSGK
jgi:hypothetical protein